MPGSRSSAADVKGDLSGLAAAGCGQWTPWWRAPRSLGLSMSPTFSGDVSGLFGEQGHPSGHISEMGPLLLSRLMDLNEVQEGVLNIASGLPTTRSVLLRSLPGFARHVELPAEACR